MSPSVFVPLAHYCERGADPALTAEPLNALSNVAFFLAALLSFTRLPPPNSSLDTRAERLLIALVILVGVGSTLFHTFATPWAMAADVIPITAFVVAFAFVAAHRFLRLSWTATCVGSAMLVASEVAAHFASNIYGFGLNGSAPYIPPLCLLVMVALAARKTCPQAAPKLLAAAAVFALSLTARTLDHELCDAIVVFAKPRGTHALWHTLNAGVLALLLEAAISTAPRRRDEPKLKDCEPRAQVS